MLTHSFELTNMASRDYNTVVTENHFPLGFIAPIVVTPENEKEIEAVKASANYVDSPLLGQPRVS
jgi:hypothetical protein